jgi:hypothetical protein
VAASGAGQRCGTRSAFGQARRARSTSTRLLARRVFLASGVLIPARAHGGGIAVDTTRWVLLIHQVAPRTPASGPELRKRQGSLHHVAPSRGDPVSLPWVAVSLPWVAVSLPWVAVSLPWVAVSLAWVAVSLARAARRPPAELPVRPAGRAGDRRLAAGP